MSLVALLLATRDHLRTQLSLNESQCDIQPDGRPPANMGERYVALWEDGSAGAGTTGGGASTLSETCGLLVTVTRRTGRYGRDRRRNIFLEEITGLEPLCRSIKAAIHANWGIVNAANARISDAYNKFQLPLFWVRQDRAQGMDADWAGSAAEKDDSTYLVVSLRFAGALRVQPLGEAG